MLPGCVGNVGPACKSTVDRFHLDLAFFRDKTVIDKGGGGTGVIILLNLFADIAGKVIKQEQIHGRDCKAGGIRGTVTECTTAVFFIDACEKLAEGIPHFGFFKVTVLIEGLQSPPCVDEAALLFTGAEDQGTPPVFGMQEPEIGGYFVIHVEGFDHTGRALFFFCDQAKEHGSVDDGRPVYCFAWKAGGQDRLCQSLQGTAVGFTLFFIKPCLAQGEQTLAGVGILGVGSCPGDSPVGGAGKKPVEQRPLTALHLSADPAPGGQTVAHSAEKAADGGRYSEPEKESKPRRSGDIDKRDCCDLQCLDRQAKQNDCGKNGCCQDCSDQ